MLAMKDLIRNYMITKEEAAENIRNGIKNNITTHVVWHVYDLWQRYKCKCDEVIKAIQCEKIGKVRLLALHIKCTFIFYWKLFNKNVFILTG
ncbi:unnamed protein product, partial [Rotaria sp. Silwood1]